MVLGMSHLKSSLTLKGLGGRGGGLCQGSGEVSPPAKRWVLAACTGTKEHATDNKKTTTYYELGIFIRCEKWKKGGKLHTSKERYEKKI
jgi:hypothetical protein